MINCSFSNPQSENGFTLIEIIVVFSVIAILSSIGIVASVNYSRAQSLETATQDLKSILNQAKSYAQSQYKPSGCNNQTLEKYKIDINKNTKVYTLSVICGGDNNYPIVSNHLPNDINFDKSYYFEYPILTGGIKGDGSSPWEIKLLGSDEREKIITINSNGSIE